MSPAEEGGNSCEPGGPASDGPGCDLSDLCRTKGSVDILLAGVGGQGILLISRLLGEAAIRAGVHFVMSEVHGMAQRGGVVSSHVRLGEVHGPLISEGCADVLLAMEPAEALRAAGMAGPHTTVITSTRKVIPFTVAASGEEYPDLEEIMRRLEAKVARVIRFDATEAAREAGAAVATNVVLLGALAGTGVLPMPVDAVKAALEENVPAKLVAVNLKAFELGYGITSGQ